MRKSWGLALTLMLGASPGWLMPSPAGAADVVGVTDDTIKIGTFAAETGSVAIFFVPLMHGAQVVYEEVNKAGGIHGRKIQFLAEDDRCDAATAIGAVKKLIHQDQVFMIHGGGCSNAALAALPEIQKAKLPWVIFAAVADELTVPVNPYIYTTALSASIESHGQLEFALKKGAKRIAVISQRDAWGRARYTPLMEAFKKKGVTPVADEEISPDANDATPQVLRIRQAKADAVIFVVYPKAATTFVRDAQKVGFKPLLVGQTVLGDLLSLQTQIGIPGAVDRFFSISHVRYTPEDPEMERWRGIVKQYFPRDRLSLFHSLGIASSQVVVEVLKRVGRDLTRERFVNEMTKLKGFDTGIYPGVITCTDADHQCHKTPAWVHLEGGRVKTVDVTTVER